MYVEEGEVFEMTIKIELRYYTTYNLNVNFFWDACGNCRKFS